MRKVRLWKLIFYLSLGYIFLLVLFLAKQNSTSLNYSRLQWYRDFSKGLRSSYLSKSEIGKKSENPYYYNGEVLAYLEDTGEIEHLLVNNTRNHISANSKFYLSYSKNPNSIELFSKLGEKQWSLPIKSYAHISPNSLLIALILSDNSSLSIYDINRSLVIESRYLGKFITDFSFASFNDSVVFGTIEGNLYFYNPQKKKLTQFREKQGSLDYIKGLDLSKTGRYIAVLSGKMPEKLSLYEKNPEKNSTDTAVFQTSDDAFTERWSVATQASRVKKNSMHISERQQVLFEERHGEIHVINLQNGKTLRKKMLNTAELGAINYVLFDVSKSFYAVAAVHAKGLHIQVLSLSNDSLQWEKTFKDAFFLYVEILEDTKFSEIVIHTSRAIYRYQIVHAGS